MGNSLAEGRLLFAFVLLSFLWFLGSSLRCIQINEKMDCSRR